MRHPGFGDIELAEGSAPNQVDGAFLSGNTGTPLAGYRYDLGHSVRSMQEANIARCLKVAGFDYVYEKEYFPLTVTMKKEITNSGITNYTPDFFIPSTGDYIEVKGSWRNKSISTVALMKLAMFTEQYPDKNLVLIHSYDYRKDFPGLNLKTKEEILIPEMEEVFSVVIKEHPDLFWWENGSPITGYNIRTCPRLSGEDSKIDDWKRYLDIMWWKTPVMMNRMFITISKYETSIENAEREISLLEQELPDKIIYAPEIRHANHLISMMRGYANEYPENLAFADIDRFNHYGREIEFIMPTLRDRIKEYREEAERRKEMSDFIKKRHWREFLSEDSGEDWGL